VQRSLDFAFRGTSPADGDRGDRGGELVGHFRTCRRFLTARRSTLHSAIASDFAAGKGKCEEIPAIPEKPDAEDAPGSTIVDTGDRWDTVLGADSAGSRLHALAGSLANAVEVPGWDY